MELKQLAPDVWYRPHEPERDRPMLCYIRGGRYALAVDAGYSRAQVQDFYRLLGAAGLPLPDFTAITHWHFDHTLGMAHIHGVSVASQATNAHLRDWQARARQPGCAEDLRRTDRFFAAEYPAGPMPQIAQADILFRDRLTLALGGVTAELFRVVSPHTEDSTCVYLPEKRLLFLGDSVCEDVYNGGILDRRRLAALVETIRGIDCDCCVLSHEPPLPKRQLLAELEAELD